MPAARRHIIERPRLTRLLDETTARVITLVAPAGYGKTTLGRQWLESRPHAWYVASGPSADVAAVGIGISQAAERLVPDVGHRFRQWLRTRRGTENTGLAADLLARDLDNWPRDGWLGIDDYQWLTADAELLIDRLRRAHHLRLLITSRRRPVWSTPRDVLYGALYELGAVPLAMSGDEAGEVLAGLRTSIAEDLIALADGWPAIIGLASFAEEAALPKRGVLPPALHAYVADELYASVEPTARIEIAKLALLPFPSTRLARRLIGSMDSVAIAEGCRVGFLTEEDPDTYTIHPLLRAFLLDKLGDLPSKDQRAVLHDAVRILLEEKSWQGAYEIVEQFKQLDCLDELIAASLWDLMGHGLLATLSTFVGFGRTNGAQSAVLDLAEAEVAFRSGFHERSMTLAEKAAKGLRERPDLAAKAHCNAGQSAYFADKIDLAVDHFLKARELAEHDEDERSALWGLFISAMEQEDEAAIEFLHEFENISGASADDLARLQSGRLLLGMRLGSLAHGLSGSEAVAEIVTEARDPSVRASFWHGYAGALRVAAAYVPALEAAEHALSEISEFDLNFARGHVFVTQAGVYLGMEDYDRALSLLEEVGRIGNRNNDVFLQMNERMLRCRLHLLNGDVLNAARVTDVAWPHLASSGQSAEFLACRALAIGMLGEKSEDAFEILADAERRSRENEASVLCLCVRALLTLDGDTTSASQTITNGFRNAVARGVLDPLVFAFRQDRRLARLVHRTAALRPALNELMAIVDGPAGKDDGGTAESASGLENLTPREREVFALVAEGKTNKEIATILFLTEGTVKVHVRHILRKLGARTRVEAAIFAVRTRQREALAPSNRTPKPQQSDSSL